MLSSGLCSAFLITEYAAVMVLLWQRLRRGRFLTHGLKDKPDLLTDLELNSEMDRVTRLAVLDRD